MTLSAPHSAHALYPPKMPPIPSSAIRFAKHISYYVYNGALPRPTCHSIRTARRLYRPAPCSAPLGTRPLSANLLARCVIRRIHSNAKFNREPCRKKQEPSKAPIKFMPKNKNRLAQARAKADLEAKFYAQLLKKAAI